MVVRILYRPPSRKEQERSPLHERCLETVPVAVAEKMAADFRLYQQKQIRQTPLYQYEQNGEDVMLAVDFTEVVSLTIDTDL